MSKRDQQLRAELEARVGRLHAWQRLGIESEHERQVFGQGRTFFHIENSYSIHAFIRAFLRLSFLLGRGRRNARRIEVRHNTVTLKRLPKAFDGYTILHLSDIHLDMASDIPAVLTEAVAGLEYDLCVITGDFRARTHGQWQSAVDSMQRVRTVLRDPVYAVLGNHDSLWMVPGLESMGIRMLLNESVFVERGGERLYIAGVDDPHYFKADNIEKAADSIPPDAAGVLLAHSPEIYRHAAHAGFGLLLCGHTHGGQICLPGGLPMMLNAKCPRDYCAGTWKHMGMQGYTSSGAGVSVVDVRLNCPAEVTLHRLVTG